MIGLGYEIDDSALLHGGVYDPVKAREYYLRTRKLKGRKKGSSESNLARSRTVSKAPASRPGGKPNRANTASRRAELEAQKKALEKRLERLREALEELVSAAKKRSGVKEKDRAPETQKDKADRNADQKKDKPETAAQKKEKAKKAKEAYEKENPTSLSKDVEVLKEQIADVRASIEKQLALARERRNKAGKQETKSGSKNDNDGPRGR